jgi:hypothetical protein
MSILQQRASDVRIQEINLSQVITSASSAVGCQVVVSSKGSTKPTLFTNAQDYLAAYGNPNPKVSFDIYCGLDFFREGDTLWAVRCVHSDALYAGVTLYENGTVTGLNSASSGIANIDFPNWPALVPNPGNTPIALFYPINGQGSYANTLGIAITSSNISAPTNFAAASSNTGGSLAAGTYQYQISAVNANGETLASAPVQVIIAGPGVSNSVAMSWDPVPLETGYIIYGRTTGTVGEIETLGQGNYAFVDTGAITPDTTKQPLTSPSQLGPADPQFTVSVYDTAVSTVTALETFVCTFTQGVDDSGVATELEARINPFSQYIQVVSNVPALITVPTVLNNVGLTLMAGGNSGTAPTSYDVAAAYKQFGNKQLYAINILINGGHADPIVQLAMDDLVQARGDAIALLDTPSASQKFQQAINYRNLTLNLNSSYSALFCPDVLEADDINGMQQFVPFSGWAAALCARTDRVANPSFSIAGLNRGLVSVLKSRYAYDDGEATELFKAQINYTRTFIGQGIALWEQKTLAAQDSALSWLSVRRIINVIKVSLYKFLLYSLQEPNDDFTGRQIVGACTDYLNVIKHARGITDFDVVSDTSNNSAAQFNSGIRVVTVIIIPTIPIHEIDLQVVISKQGVSFSETLKSLG